MRGQRSGPKSPSDCQPVTPTTSLPCLLCLVNYIITQIRVITNLTDQEVSTTIIVGVTGRTDLQRILSKTLEPRLHSILLSQAVADEILRAISDSGYAIVPNVPTEEMLDADSGEGEH